MAAAERHPHWPRMTWWDRRHDVVGDTQVLHRWLTSLLFPAYIQ